MKLKNILSAFKDFEVATNFDCSEVDVSGLTVMDAPDVDIFENQDVFILTTAYIFKDSIEDFIALIPRIKANGTAAIGIKIDRFLKTLPQTVLEVANEYRLPIIFIPSYYPYLDIMMPMFTEILNEKLSDMMRTEKFQHQFTEMVLEDQSIQKMLNYLASILHTDYVFIDYYSGDVYKTKENIGISKKIQCYTRKIYDKYKKLLAAFYVTIDEREISYLQKMAIEHFLNAVHIIISRKINLELMDERYKNDLVYDICINNISTKEELKNRSRVFGWNIEGKWNCVIFDIDHYKEKYLQSRFDNHMLEDLKKDMSEDIQVHLKELGITGHYFLKSNSIMYILRDSKEKSNFEKRRQFIQEILTSIKEKSGTTMTIGVGNTRQSMMDVHLSYQEALEAIKISRALSNENVIVYYKDVVIYKYILDSIHHQGDLARVIQPVLKLIEHDKTNRKDYFKTMEALIQNNWEISKTAQNCFMHYNTIRYRYEKIGKILQIDLDSHVNRFNIEFAYRFYKMSK